MHLKTIDKNGLKETLYLACFGEGSSIRQTMMNSLEQMEYMPGFIWCLVRCVNIDDLGKDFPSECRQLASILLKTFVVKHWQPNGTSQFFKKNGDDVCSSDEEPECPISTADKQAIKEFLLSYMHEPDCKIASQLAYLAAKIAVFDFPNQWPELITTLMKYLQNNDSNPLQGFRASYYIHDILVELVTNKSDGNFPTILQEICISNFSHVVRAWANNSKYIQGHLTHLISHLNESNVSSLTRHYCFELKSYHTATLMKILKIFLEVALPSIIEKVACFQGFWKTYLNSIQIFSGFIHKIRPICRQLAVSAFNGGNNKNLHRTMSAVMEEEQLEAEIVSQRCSTGNSLLRSSTIHCSVASHEHSIERTIADFLHRHAISEVESSSEEDSSSFYFIPMSYFSASTEALFISVNTVLMFLRCQNCTPIVLQQRYPLLVIPWMESLLQFYFKHLIDEYPLSSSDSTVSVPPSNCPNNSHTILPLKYLSLAASAFLSNVLTCDQYADYNIYVKVNGKDTNQIKDAQAYQANQILRAFFTPERSAALTQRLLSFMLGLSEEDLITWENEPERFFAICDTVMHHVQERRGSTVNGHMPPVITLRFFSERLVDGLLRYNPGVLANIVHSYLNDVNRQFRIASSSANDVPSSDNSRVTSYNAELILWDNIYYCGGMCVDTLIDVFHFNLNEWLLKVMSPMFTYLLQSPNHGVLVPNKQQLLRSRMLWLLTKWMNRIDGQLYPQILSFLVSLLRRENESDLVVRLRTVQAISCLMNNTQDFVFASLLPHLIPITQGLCLILQELEEIDGKVMILTTLKDMVQLLGVTNIHSSFFSSSSDGRKTLRRYFVAIADFVASVWNSLQCSDVIRSNVLELLLEMTKSARGDSTHIAVYLLPVILQSLGIRVVGNDGSSSSSNRAVLQGNNLFLVNEGILLWVALMRNVQTPTDAQLSELALLLHYVVEAYCFAAGTTISGNSDPNGELLPEDLNQDEIILRFLFLAQSYVVVFGEKLFTKVNGDYWIRFLVFLQKLTSSPRPASACSTVSSVNRMKEEFVKVVELMLISDSNISVRMLVESGIFMQFLVVSLANAPCVNLSNFMASYKEQSMQVVYCYLNIIARVMIKAPVMLRNCLMTVKTEMERRLGELQCGPFTSGMVRDDCLLDQLVQVMFLSFDDLRARGLEDWLLRSRLWTIALWSLLPPSANTCTKLNPTTANNDDYAWCGVLSWERLNSWMMKLLHVTIAAQVEQCNVLDGNPLKKRCDRIRKQLILLLSFPFGVFEDEVVNTESDEYTDGDDCDDSVADDDDQNGCNLSAATMITEDLKKFGLTAYLPMKEDEKAFLSAIHALGNIDRHGELTPTNSEKFSVNGKNAIIEREECILSRLCQVMVVCQEPSVTINLNQMILERLHMIRVSQGEMIYGKLLEVAREYCLCQGGGGI